MGFMSEIREHRVRAIKSLALCVCFISHGLSIGIIGPSLLDMGLMVDSSVDKMSFVFPARCIGNIVGSIVNGLVYPYVNFQLSMTFFMATWATIHVIIPLMQSYSALIMMFIFNGFIGGLVNSSGNIFMLELWGKENAPFFQALQGTFGLGAFIAPLIVRLFVMELTDDLTDFEGEHHPLLAKSSNETLRNKVVRNQRNITDGESDVTFFDHNELKIQYPYFITAVSLFIPSIYYFFLWWFHPHSNPHPSRATTGVVDAEGKAVSLDETSRQSARSGSIVSNVEMKEIERIRNSKTYLRYKMTAIGLIMLFMPIYYGLEITYGQYLTPFAVKSDLHLSKTTGTEITSVYWAMFSFFRVLATLYIEYLGSEINIILNLCVIHFSILFLVPLGSRYEWCLWTGSILMGMGCSSLWGSAFGFLEDFFPISPKIGSFIVVSNALGEFVIPAIISAYIKTYPNIFLVITLVCSLSMAVLFAMIRTICKMKLQIKIASVVPNCPVIQNVSGNRADIVRQPTRH